MKWWSFKIWVLEKSILFPYSPFSYGGVRAIRLISKDQLRNQAICSYVTPKSEITSIYLYIYKFIYLSLSRLLFMFLCLISTEIYFIQNLCVGSELLFCAWTDPVLWMRDIQADGIEMAWYNGRNFAVLCLVNNNNNNNNNNNIY